MRRDRLYLQDMVEAADAIARFLQGTDLQCFREDEMLQSAVLLKLVIIGEAAARIDRRFRSRRSDIPWAKTIGLRNIGVHAYFAINWEIVWDTVSRDVPLLRDQIASILAESPE